MPRVTLQQAVAEGCKVTVRRLRQLCENGGIPSAKRYGMLWTVITDGRGRIRVIPSSNGPCCTIEQPPPRKGKG